MGNALVIMFEEYIEKDGNEEAKAVWLKLNVTEKQELANDILKLACKWGEKLHDRLDYAAIIIEKIKNRESEKK
jgi:hypothetical protein